MGRLSQRHKPARGNSARTGIVVGVSTVHLLAPRAAATLHARQLSYPYVGATRTGMPASYTQLRRSLLLAAQRDFEAAANDLLSWQVQRRAGLTVQASSRQVELDGVVLLRVGIGPVGVGAPCRVVYVERTDIRCGFGYGTLTGHPEQGEEAFVLERRPDGRIVFTVTAFSRPATLLAKAGGPLGRVVQRAVAQRYLHKF
jgi:uncharacterized protein (UPF0548 family)